MSDSVLEEDSKSNTRLIEVQHVGVTAKIRSPLRTFLASTSVSHESADDTKALPSQHTTYDKFSNLSHFETTDTTDCSRALYEMRTMQVSRRIPRNKSSLSKIEFKLYKKPVKLKQRRKKTHIKRKVPAKEQNGTNSALKRIIYSFNMLWTCKHQKQKILKTRRPKENGEKEFVGRKKQVSPLLRFDEPECKENGTQTVPVDVHLGIYAFDRGCGDFLRTTDCHPQILSDVLAARATHWATRFWAEVFGSLHIAVAFVVTFVLQAYRFLLYSLINTCLVGFVHMTSDYFIKPLLTVTFNGVLQPLLIFMQNVFTSFRDICAPIADNFNNFMQPLATLGRSLRLVDVHYVGNRVGVGKEV